MRRAQTTFPTLNLQAARPRAMLARPKPIDQHPPPQNAKPTRRKRSCPKREGRICVLPSPCMGHGAALAYPLKQPCTIHRPLWQGRTHGTTHGHPFSVLRGPHHRRGWPVSRNLRGAQVGNTLTTVIWSCLGDCSVQGTHILAEAGELFPSSRNGADLKIVWPRFESESDNSY